MKISTAEKDLGSLPPRQEAAGSPSSLPEAVQQDAEVLFEVTLGALQLESALNQTGAGIRVHSEVTPVSVLRLRRKER